MPHELDTRPSGELITELTVTSWAGHTVEEIELRLGGSIPGPFAHEPEVVEVDRPQGAAEFVQRNDGSSQPLALEWSWGASSYRWAIGRTGWLPRVLVCDDLEAILREGLEVGHSSSRDPELDVDRSWTWRDDGQLQMTVDSIAPR